MAGLSHRFDAIAPVDYRYYDPDVARFLSEEAFTRAKLDVETALVTVLARRGLCGQDVVDAVKAAAQQVTAADVYQEEDRIRHDIRALANCLRSLVPDSAKPYIHFSATSYDIVDTANAKRFRDVTTLVAVPALTKLARVLVALAIRESETVQVGRTHGQHAVPITFGFAMAGYVSRLGAAILALQDAAGHLVGKFSGAVGAYNASSLFFDDPEAFEAEVLAELGLKPGDHSTQIVQPEPMERLLAEYVRIGGILANISRDMRHLQRTEIGEVGEAFGAAQVGSSTMPQKRNPINFENVESLWKVLIGRLVTVQLDQISEHQRDLTNSASGRTYGEIVGYLVEMAKRLTRTMEKLVVDPSNIERNLEQQRGLIVAEPLYLILAALGHPDAHETVRLLTLQAQREERSLSDVIATDGDLRSFLDRMTDRQRAIILDPSLYIGIAADKARAVAKIWGSRLGLFDGIA